jgi:hypothetical protein
MGSVMTDSHPQRRHFARIHFDSDYHLSTPDHSKKWSGEILDLSLHGALLRRPTEFDGSPGDKLNLEFKLGDTDTHIQMEAHVAHVHDDLVGLECEHIDVESMTHLRKILELNLGDPDLMERELPEMLQLYQTD